MIKRLIENVFNYFGYGIHRIRPRSPGQRPVRTAEPPPIEPVWPLPRASCGLSDQDIRREFAKYDFWHYSYRFDGDLCFSVRHSTPSKRADAPERHLQRFRHFMPYVLNAYNGSLQGKRVLDIACNSGFWSIQCALLGAEVVGFDARPELIEQANLIRSIVGTENVEFKVLDFWDMNPQMLGGTFDVVLNLGILYQLPEPLEVLKLTTSMARKYVLLDTTVYPMDDSVVKLEWREPVDIRSNVTPGIVARPTKSSIDLMLRHIRVRDWFEIPIRTTEMPFDYLRQRRASWLIEV